MLVLAFESSCDETAASLVEGDLALSEVVRGQVSLHRVYGGVVPEIASRAHLEAVDVIAAEVLRQGQKTFADLDGLAVTQGPGLVGALLVAINFAKGLSLATGLPLTGVNHVKAHALAPFLRSPGPSGEAPPSVLGEIEFPLVALVASGGHTSLFWLESFTRFKTLGKTLDDAAGEAFDKSAKLMGLGYPGGPIIEEMAAGGDPAAYRLKRPFLRGGLNFSFSGLKTAVARVYARENMEACPAGARELKDLAASFQAAVVDVLVAKLLAALQKTRAKGAILAGGVAANGALRARARMAAESVGVPLYVPKLSWCADNASMIGFLGGLQLADGENILSAASEAQTRWSAGEDY
ncbi:MAG: tRNA (adenosine(37)-N6)-threonylcarbamoyltransferase complex transferase subunit TsaD [Deltaproteobacteria bacterium]|jgi:N6-L-threonylcarbamoyladenine synthase|nr:tRNA (adenosine(37)-N6)-threonylcarbamoyltransferase complex transferase subunit TsaD [Deltaproteobacteria bacterium]